MTWFVLAVLVLTAYRATRLITRDTFPPVLWLRDNLAGGWRHLSLWEQELYSGSSAMDQRRLRNNWSYDPQADDPQRYVRRRDWAPAWLAELITCPWCASAYVSGLLVLVTDLTYGVPVPWLVGPAVWAGAALLASKEWA